MLEKKYKNDNNVINNPSQVCLCLRFLASGAIYSAVGDTQGVDKATVCRSVRAVVTYLNTLQDRYYNHYKSQVELKLHFENETYHIISHHITSVFSFVLPFVFTATSNGHRDTNSQIEQEIFIGSAGSHQLWGR